MHPVSKTLFEEYVKHCDQPFTKKADKAASQVLRWWFKRRDKPQSWFDEHPDTVQKYLIKMVMTLKYM